VKAPCGSNAYDTTKGMPLFGRIRGPLDDADERHHEAGIMECVRLFEDSRAVRHIVEREYGGVAGSGCHGLPLTQSPTEHARPRADEVPLHMARARRRHQGLVHPEHPLSLLIPLIGTR